MKITPDIVDGIIRLCDESDSSFGKLVLSNEKDTPVGVLIFAQGDRLDDVLEAIGEMEARWELEEEVQ